jgi:hypothetical protein
MFVIVFDALLSVFFREKSQAVVVDKDPAAATVSLKFGDSFDLKLSVFLPKSYLEISQKILGKHSCTRIFRVLGERFAPEISKKILTTYR